MKFVRIEPGSFLMGLTDDQMDQLMRLFPNSQRESFDHEQPEHRVEITRPFYLGIHEVTQGQYQAVMARNPSHFKGSDDLPVEQVSWFDAVLFCNKLSEKEKKTPFYRIDDTEVTIAGGNGYRLPTEAEWEYACRAGSSTLYPSGDEVSKLGDHAWFRDNSKGGTRLVGQKRPNAWGLYDCWGMCGSGVRIGTRPGITGRLPQPTRRVRLRGPSVACSGAARGRSSRGTHARRAATVTSPRTGAATRASAVPQVRNEPGTAPSSAGWPGVVAEPTPTNWLRENFSGRLLLRCGISAQFLSAQTDSRRRGCQSRGLDKGTGSRLSLRKLCTLKARPSLPHVPPPAEPIHLSCGTGSAGARF
jgi:hypothetical protein